MCWFSQMIRNSVRWKFAYSTAFNYIVSLFQSSAIPEKAYESIWYTKSVHYQKGVIMMIQNNQRHLYLKAFKFADLSMERFLSVRQK